MSIFREYKIVVVSLLALLIANGPPPAPPLVYAVTSTRKMDLNIVPKHHSYSDALCTIYRMQLEAEGKLSISWLAWLSLLYQYQSKFSRRHSVRCLDQLAA
jgi:hypothetical protein